MNAEKGRVCPVENAGALDNKLRKWLQNPAKILSPFIKEGMTVLDIGCGPGFFSVEMAKMLGNKGKVLSVDLQEGMLLKLEEKIKNTSLEEIIVPVKCRENEIPVEEKVDFVLAFYMVHEVKDKDKFFIQLNNILNTGGKVLIVEPKFHVKKESFDQTLTKAHQAGFKIEKGPKLAFSLSSLLMKD